MIFDVGDPMKEMEAKVALDNGLELGKLLTSGSVLQICEDYNEFNEVHPEDDDDENKDVIGEPIYSFNELEQRLVNVDDQGFVKKKIIDEGGGLPLHEGCTVSIAFSGYWEAEPFPFDIRKPSKPLVVDLRENGLLPGLLIAVKSMLVGETSLFLLSHQLMYGELGVLDRIKPKAKCAFYIKLVKSILTPEEGPLDFSEPNSFVRVHKEVKILYASGVALHKAKNFTSAIHMFRKGVNMLHKCRLADENEEMVQTKLLIKLYTNLAICYNLIKLPYKACIACNELHRLGSLWNNGKVLYQNAKALRMIGQFEEAERKLKRAINLCPNNKEIKSELELLVKNRDECNAIKIRLKNSSQETDIISEHFKQEVDNLIKSFKDYPELCKLTLPGGMNSSELAYVKEVCIRENVFFNNVQSDELQDYNGAEE